MCALPRILDLGISRTVLDLNAANPNRGGAVNVAMGIKAKDREKIIRRAAAMRGRSGRGGGACASASSRVGKAATVVLSTRNDCDGAGDSIGDGDKLRDTARLGIEHGRTQRKVDPDWEGGSHFTQSLSGCATPISALQICSYASNARSCADAPCYIPGSLSVPSISFKATEWKVPQGAFVTLGSGAMARDDEHGCFEHLSAASLDRHRNRRKRATTVESTLVEAWYLSTNPVSVPHGVRIVPHRFTRRLKQLEQPRSAGYMRTSVRGSLL